MKRTAIILLITATLAAGLGIAGSTKSAQAHPPFGSVRVHVGTGYFGFRYGGFPIYSPVIRPYTPYPVVTTVAPAYASCCHYERVWVPGRYNPVLGVHYGGYWALVRVCHVHGRTVIRRY